ncbi:MAG: transketolase family protein [Firmicutes bacterium]|jgi:transketolase|nr:transketolase family protein [Bacillota bacterium]
MTHELNARGPAAGSPKTATREAYGKALVELGRARPDVVVLDADLSKSTMTARFAREFPDRFYNVGIAEQNLMGTAAGLALGGLTPFASTFAVFAAGRAYDQVRQSIAYPGLNVKICATHAGITVGADGATHQAIEDIALMRVLPNMTVIVPADDVETEQAVKTAASHEGPVYIRLGRHPVPRVTPEGYEFEVGKATVLRQGDDVALVACGIGVSIALSAAEMLAARGIRAAVLNVSTIKPLDARTIVSAAERCGRVVTIEEHSTIGGLGGAVCELLSERRPVAVRRVGVPDVFGQSGPPDELLRFYGLTPENVVSAVEEMEGR